MGRGYLNNRGALRQRVKMLSEVLSAAWRYTHSMKGCVKMVHESSDGLVRKASPRARGASFDRPIHRLVKLSEG